MHYRRISSPSAQATKFETREPSSSRAAASSDVGLAKRTQLANRVAHLTYLEFSFKTSDKYGGIVRSLVGRYVLSKNSNAPAALIKTMR